MLLNVFPFLFLPFPSLQTFHPESKLMEIGKGDNKRILPMTAAQFYEKKEFLREKIVR
jgi:hypothetical protein